MDKQDSNLEYYKWLPLNLIKKDDQIDTALFQLDNYDGTLLLPLKLGNAEKMQVGDAVYFIGFPYAAQLMNEGYGITLIVNQGIISSVKRNGINPDHPLDWFIIDAISNPGNSGCPLINSVTNEVVGQMISSFRTPSRKYQDLEIREPMHIAGAKPINLAKNFLKKL